MKTRINEIIQEGKANPKFAEVFKVIDEISEFMVTDQEFFKFASSIASANKNKDKQYGYISPTEMFILAYDYLNKTGKYADYLAKIEKDKEDQAKRAAERKAKQVQDEAKTKEENAKLEKEKKEEEKKANATIFDLF